MTTKVTKGKPIHWLLSIQFARMLALVLLVTILCLFVNNVTHETVHLIQASTRVGHVSEVCYVGSREDFPSSWPPSVMTFGHGWVLYSSSNEEDEFGAQDEYVAYGVSSAVAGTLGIVLLWLFFPILRNEFHGMSKDWGRKPCTTGLNENTPLSDRP